MSFWEIMLIGFALATDAFALTVANCAAYEKTLDKRKEWSMPTAFALFQFAMPVIGFYIGNLFLDFISSFAYFLTAGIFFILAVKIVIDKMEERRKKDADKPVKQREFTVKTLIVQAIATSIDALAVGVTFAAGISYSIFFAAGIIGAVTFLTVTAALFIGRSLGRLLGEYAVWAGAAILFGLAIKSLIEGLI